MRIEPAFEIADLDVARELVRRHPFATIVTAGLRATHMPCLLDEQADGLTILGHVAKADPVADELGGPVLLIFHGPHGYVSASWYAERDTIPTWNHVTLHVRGTPELIDAPYDLLTRTVDHFEACAPEPWRLTELDDDGAEMAQQVVG